MSALLLAHHALANHLVAQQVLANIHAAAATPLPVDASAVPVSVPTPVQPGAVAATPVPAGTPTSATTAINLPTLVLSILIWTPFVTAIGLMFTTARSAIERGRVRVAGLCATTVSLTIALLTMSGQISADPSGGLGGTTAGVVEQHSWIHSFPVLNSYHLDADGLTLPLLLLSCVVFLCAVLTVWKHDHQVRQRVVWLLCLETAVNGTLCAQDGLLLVLFWGMQTAPLYLLLRGQERGSARDAHAVHRREQMANRVLIAGLVSTGLLALGLLLATVQAAPDLSQGVGGNISNPSFDLAGVTSQNFAKPVAIVGFVLTFLAGLIALGAFPFHRWYIGVVADAEPGLAAVVGGITSRLGGFVILRVSLTAFPAVAIQYSTGLVVLAIVVTGWGAFGAVVASDLRRFIAHISLAQTGVFLLGVAALNTVSLVGGVLVLVVGGLVTALLTLVAAAIEERTKQRSFARLGGLAFQVPRLSAFWIFGVLTAIGVPLFAGFTAEFTLFVGSFAQHHVGTAVVLATLLVVAGALLWNLQRIFLGPPREAFERLKDGTALEYSYLTPLVVLAVLYGVLPGRVMGVIANGVQLVTGRLSGS